MRFMVAGAVLLTVASSATCDFVEFEDLEEWESALPGSATTIDFVFEHAQILTDQYADFGVLFIDGNDVASDTGSAFVNDGWGCRGGSVAVSPIHIMFLEPMNWVAVEFPGDTQFEVLMNGEHLYTSDEFFERGDGDGVDVFGGIISTGQPFDEVLIHDPVDGEVAIDDLFFGQIDPHQPDLNADGIVDGADVGILLGAWGTSGPGDLNEDGMVNGADLGLMLASWAG